MPTYSVYVDPLHASEHDMMELSLSLDKDFTSVLSGASFSSINERSWEGLRIMLNQPDVLEDLSSWLMGRDVFMNEVVASPSLTPKALNFKPLEFMDQCREALEQSGMACDDQDHETLCMMTGHMLDTIMGTSILKKPQSPFLVHFMEKGQNCSGGCGFLMISDNNDYVTQYYIEMLGYIPKVRMIETSVSHASGLYAFISSSGKIEGFIYKHRHLTSPKDLYLTGFERYLFDANWKLLRFNYGSSGNRRIFIDSLEGFIETHQNSLLTDGKRTTIETPLRALIMDAGIDIRIPGLLSRLQVNFQALLTAVETGQLTPPIFSYPRDPLSRTLDIIHGDHGASVAAILAADLPNLQLDLIPNYSRMDSNADASKIRDRWIVQIKKSAARVVNISMDFSLSMASCENSIGAVFKALPDVLFVVAMGNDGANHFIGACPIGIAPYHPNVLTVAGTDSQGFIANESNYGRDIAMVAAPFEIESVRLAPDKRPQDTQLRKRGGTSVSAPWVSNLALRLISRHPELTPPELIGILMKACTKSNSDVACGGQIDADSLEDI